ncbi:MAG: methylenetetrahydrofolate reductase [Pseudomonadota bacterium]
MKITDMWASASRPTVSFELYPARGEKAAAKLETTIDELADLKPDFVSVTFGAGGSTREGSRQLIDKLKNGKKLETVAYFACFGLGPGDIASVLDDYRQLGVQNVLAVRGDPPHGQDDFKPHPESLAHASDLVAFIESRYGFCLGAAGYPEGHIEAESRDKDLEYLKLKVDNGAQYIIANYFYDNAFFFDFVDRCRALGIQVPVLPGVMPIYGAKMMRNLAGLCGATIVEEIEKGLAAIAEGDKKAVAQFGIDYAVKQCRGLIEKGVVGLHIYTMDRSGACRDILGRLRGEGLL